MNDPNADRWGFIDACVWLPWHTRGTAGWSAYDRRAADRVLDAAESVRDHDPDRMAELLTSGDLADTKHHARVALYWLARELARSPDPAGLMDELVAATTTPATMVGTSATLELAAALATHLFCEADVTPEDTELHRLLRSSEQSATVAVVTAVGLLALIWGHYPDSAAYAVMRDAYGSTPTVRGA